MSSSLQVPSIPAINVHNHALFDRFLRGNGQHRAFDTVTNRGQGRTVFEDAVHKFFVDESIRLDDDLVGKMASTFWFPFVQGQGCCP